MSLFAIADTHLSFGTNKPMDVFGGWSDYAYRLQKNWNALVGEDDYVVIAGDISWAMNFEELKKDFEFLNNLNGKKIILKGNHDYWWNTRKKIDEFIDENGFSSIQIVQNSAVKTGNFVVCGSRGWPFDVDGEHDLKIFNREILRIKMSIAEAQKLGGEAILFLHYPPVGVDSCCEEILTILENERVSRCFYGHLHGMAAKYAVNKTISSIKFSLISADFLEFCPILVEKF